MEQFIKSNRKLVKIGAGFCGTVWADDRDADGVDATLVLKRGDGAPGRSISHEYEMHNHVLSALQTYRVQNQNKGDSEGLPFNIPSSLAFLSPDATEWPSLLARMPPNFTACRALINERIMPMPHQVRELLTQRYWSGGNGAEMAAAKANESCLIRAYLGRRTLLNGQGRQRPNGLQFFSLRNFPLHVDQMEELALPMSSYATAMADALAFMHWVARIDANDVEFVLARCREDGESEVNPNQSHTTAKIYESEAFGKHALWVLDFDCCKHLEMSEQGMLRAAECFLRNDPYYPRPGGATEQDKLLWNCFQDRFLMTSKDLLHEEALEIQRLPRVLMDIIAEKRDAWKRGPVR